MAYVRPTATEQEIEARVEEFHRREDPEKELRRLYTLADLSMSQAVEIGLVQAELKDARRQLGTMARVIEHLLECEDGNG